MFDTMHEDLKDILRGHLMCQPVIPDRELIVPKTAVNAPADGKLAEAV